MPEHMPISILFSNAGDVVVEFPEEGLTVSLPVTCVGTNLYRLEAMPYLSEHANYGDILEAILDKDGGLRFLRVVQPSGWSTHQYILCRERIEGDAMQAMLRNVLDNGGYWEALFGGVLFICLPPGSTFDLERAFRLCD